MSSDVIAEVCLACIEAVDDKIPIIGPLMDMECVDKVEKELVKRVVDIIVNYVFDEDVAEAPLLPI